MFHDHQNFNLYGIWYKKPHNPSVSKFSNWSTLRQIWGIPIPWILPRYTVEGIHRFLAHFSCLSGFLGLRLHNCNNSKFDPMSCITWLSCHRTAHNPPLDLCVLHQPPPPLRLGPPLGQKKTGVAWCPNSVRRLFAMDHFLPRVVDDRRRII